MVVIPSTSLSRALGKVNHQYVFVYQFTTKYLQCVEKHHAPSRPPELISIAFQSQRRNDSVGSACSSSINFLTIPATQHLFHFSLHPMIQPGKLAKCTPFHKGGQKYPFSADKTGGFLLPLRIPLKTNVGIISHIRSQPNLGNSF